VTQNFRVAIANLRTATLLVTKAICGSDSGENEHAIDELTRQWKTPLCGAKSISTKYRYSICALRNKNILERCAVVLQGLKKTSDTSCTDGLASLHYRKRYRSTTFDRIHFGEQDISNLKKGMIMASNKNSRSGNQGGTHEQHVKAGQQSHKNDGNKQSGSAGSGSRSGGTRGGTPEQHAAAGRQSHKNDGKR
jgi:hypothetical protein